MRAPQGDGANGTTRRITRRAIAGGPRGDGARSRRKDGASDRDAPHADGNGSSRQILTRLRNHFRETHPVAVVSAYLFGSHAEGRAHRESDVDVGVLLNRRLIPTHGERFDLRVRLSSDLIHATGNNTVDVVVLNDAPPLFARRILWTGIEICCRDRDLDRDFRRDVQLRAADLAPFLERYRRMTLDALGR